MAFRFGDPGGRMYTAAGTSGVNILAHWTSAGTIGSWSVSAGNGRSGGSSLRQANGNDIWLRKSLDSQATWGVALAVRPAALTVGAITLGFLDSGTFQVALYIDAGGSLSVYRGQNTALLGSTVGGLVSVGSWVHVELKVTINSTTGTVALYVNGSQKLNLTGQNTRITANNSANSFQLGVTGAGSGGLLDYDDIIVYDGQTTDAAGNADITGPIGDCGLAWLLPTGAGTTTQFTPDSGSNYARVNEATPDAASYAESSTVGNKDTYALADLSASAVAVKSVAVCHYARKTDVGARQMGAVVRSGGADYTHPTGIDLSDSSVYSFRSWGRNPSGAAAWTPSAVNALEIGQVVNS